jgi:hypothetical protein
MRRQRAELVQGRRDRIDGQPAERFLPSVATMNYWMCEYARQKGFQCADNFAQYMGGDYDSNGDGQVDSDALRYVAGESEPRTSPASRRRCARRSATPIALRVVEQQLRLHPVRRHASHLQRRHRLRRPVRRHVGIERRALHSFINGKNPIWNQYGHERTGWALSTFTPRRPDGTSERHGRPRPLARSGPHRPAAGDRGGRAGSTS